jgi:hypothetical protein
VAFSGIGAGGDSAPFFANGGGGGGGGGSSQDGAIAVTPGVLYTVVVGARGVNGGAGGLSSFAGDSVTRTAPGGGGTSTSTGGAGGAAGFGGFAGGAGGAGTASGTGGGGAGGGSGGLAVIGNAGGAASGSTGGTPAAAVSGGGPGGRGGTFNVGNGAAPSTGYGGGNGGSPGGGFGRRDYAGFTDGLVKLTYLQPPSAKTLIAHRPGFSQPDALLPFVSPDVTDVPDGTTEYPVGSLIAGVPARFDGTYTVVAVNWTWNSPAASRNLFVTVKQYEQAGGASTSYSTPVKTFIPNTDPDVSLNGIVVLGEITLPGKKLPADNTTALFTVTVTDSNAADRFMDILLLDTMGATLIINSSQIYTNFYADESVDSDIGPITGSALDRPSAISVTDQCLAISGGPLTVNPEGNQSLLVYAVEGAPAVEMTYFPRWRSARYQ